MALHLEFNERRVLGVLVEKSFATPDQYPLTLNGLVSGANQKSCRDPLSSLDEENVLDALDSLRGKNLVTLVRSVGSRTDRYKHRASDTLGLEGREASVLAELLLRGPQSDGELRQRASRMVPIPGQAELGIVLQKLEDREQPLVRRLSPADQRRGVRYAHTLYPPGQKPANESTSVAESGRGGRVSRTGEVAAPDLAELRGQITKLQERVSELEGAVRRLETENQGEN